MSFLGTLFGGGSGREEGFEDLESQLRQAMQAIQGASRRGEGFLQPFQQGGVSALSQLQGMLGQDPTQLINQITGQYQQSPEFEFQKSQAQDALQNQLESAGLGSSGIGAQKSAELAGNLASQNQQQYLQNVLGQRQQQMGGLESLFSGGLGAAGQQAGLEQGLGTNLANLFGQIGQAQFGQDVAGQQDKSSFLGGLGQLGGLASLALFL